MHYTRLQYKTLLKVALNTIHQSNQYNINVDGNAFNHQARKQCKNNQRQSKTIKDNMKSERNTITKELTNEFISHKNNNDTGCYSINVILV